MSICEPEGTRPFRANEQPLFMAARRAAMTCLGGMSMIKNENIDGGKAFDWGKTSADYARYRDIYPQEFYQYLLERNICIKGQKVLDIGTGTGVLPRNLYAYGADFTGVDIAENQIEQAGKLAEMENMDIRFLCSPVEKMEFPDESFDIVTACQCFTYFDHETAAEKVSRFLKKSGKFVILYMAWLPAEDFIAGQSEKLVLQYNPAWTGCGEVRRPIEVPEIYERYFEIQNQDIYDLVVPFTRETWNGRMKACRGIGASLTEEETARFEEEHKELLLRIAPEEFEVLHYAAAAVLKKKD